MFSLCPFYSFKNNEGSRLVFAGFYVGSCPSLWLEDVMPRVSTMPQEHIWLPDRSLCRAAEGSLKGMYHVFNTLKCSSCVGASARRSFPLSVLVAEVKHSWLTRVLSCITPSTDWHVRTVFSAVCSVDWTQDPTLPSRPLCVSVRGTVYVIALIFCTHELKTGEILVLTAQVIVIQM